LFWGVFGGGGVDTSKQKKKGCLLYLGKKGAGEKPNPKKESITFEEFHGERNQGGLAKKLTKRELAEKFSLRGLSQKGGGSS